MLKTLILTYLFSINGFRTVFLDFHLIKFRLNVWQLNEFEKIINFSGAVSYILARMIVKRSEYSFFFVLLKQKSFHDDQTSRANFAFLPFLHTSRRKANIKFPQYSTMAPAQILRNFVSNEKINFNNKWNSLFIGIRLKKLPV